LLFQLLVCNDTGFGQEFKVCRENERLKGEMSRCYPTFFNYKCKIFAEIFSIKAKNNTFG
jgi:hypothetical protein